MIPLRSHALLTAALLCVSAARAADQSIDSTDASVIFVPAALDLGEWGAGGDATASVWLINTGDRAVELVRAQTGGDGLALGGVAPGALPPSGAVEFRVTLTADDREGVTRTRQVEAILAGRSPVTLDVTVRSIHPDVHLPPPEADRHAWSPVRPTPPRLDFGPAAPGERKSQPIWLVNTADTPVRLVAAKGGCGCIEFRNFEAMTIAPGRAAVLNPTMVAQGDIGSDRFKYTTFVFDDVDPVGVEFYMQIVDPRESKLRRFVAARDRGDTAAMRVCMTLDSRIWRGRRQGEGIVRSADGTAPWNDWDGFMKTQRRYEDFRVDDHAVSVRVTETSDFHRLLGCPAHSATHTYFFNDDREIEGLLITQGPDDVLPPEVCLEPFVEWAKRHEPRSLDTLYADGRIPRTRASAAQWRSALLKWHAATGQEAVDLDLPGE